MEEHSETETLNSIVPISVTCGHSCCCNVYYKILTDIGIHEYASLIVSIADGAAVGDASWRWQVGEKVTHWGPPHDLRTDLGGILVQESLLR